MMFHVTADRGCVKIFIYLACFLTVESSQVRLPAKPGVEGSDYINASHLMVGTTTVN